MTTTTTTEEHYIIRIPLFANTGMREAAGGRQPAAAKPPLRQHGYARSRRRASARRCEAHLYSSTSRMPDILCCKNKLMVVRVQNIA